MKPIILLAFANDKQDSGGGGFLSGLTAERNGIRDALKKAEEAGLCQVLVEPDASIDTLFDIFQNSNYRDRIAIFHYGGHADSYELLLESATGQNSTAHSEGLVSFLAKQRGLQLIFLNGCSTQKQCEDLIEAGLPAVIGTSRAINDSVAKGLSVRFYKGISAGSSIERAWQESVDQVITETGTEEQTRSLVWKKNEQAADIFPWELYIGEKGALSKTWNLPEASRQPLFGLDLPISYYRKLPAAPYVGLRSFKQEEAAIFFGRGEAIRALYEHIGGIYPVLLMPGKAGVGKTSLLKAGLMPRLEGRYTGSFQSAKGIGLGEALAAALRQAGAQHGLPQAAAGDKTDIETKIAEISQSLPASAGFARDLLEAELQKLNRLAGETLSFPAYWRMIEEKTALPLVVILDDVQESRGDWGAFLETLRVLFDPALNLSGRLILSYRTPAHLQVCDALTAASVPYSEMMLPPLDWDHTAEAIQGLNQIPYTRDAYRIEIEATTGSSLPDTLAGDLQEGEASMVAPILQHTLLELWKIASGEDAQKPRLSLHLYQEQKHHGAVMERFFVHQLHKIREWRRDVVQSGFVLDLLYRHTSPLGTAAALDEAKRSAIYSDRQELTEQLVEQCKDVYLLTDMPAGATILAHNFLAPVVVRQYSQSVSPGQQAARILSSKIGEFTDHPQEVWLDEADLEVVEKGMAGMRLLSSDEQKLLQASRNRKIQAQKARKRNRRILRALMAVVGLFALIAGWQWRVSKQNYLQSRSNQLAFTAKEAIKTDHTVALRIAYDAYAVLGKRSSPTVMQTLSDIFHSQDVMPVYAANFPHKGHVNSAVFSPDGSLVLTASDDGFATIWNKAGEALSNFSHKGLNVYMAAFSPNGKQVLSMTESHVRLWDMDGSLVDEDSIGEDSGDLSHFSTDGARIIPYFSQIQTPDILLQGAEAEDQQLYFSIDRKNCLVVRNNTLSLCDAQGTPMHDSLLSSVTHAAFSADGRRFVAVSEVPGADSSHLSVWDLNGKKQFEFPYPGREVTAVFSPDGKQILTSANDNSAKLWDFSQPFFHRLPPQRTAVNTAYFSLDGNRILTASHDSSARIWNLSGYMEMELIHRGVVNSARFSPDNQRIVTASRDSSARLWIPAESRYVTLGHRAEVKEAWFSPDGGQILTCSLDSTARLWTAGGAAAGSFPHRGEVISAVFSPDGKHFLSVSTDSVATLWDIRKAGQQALRVFRHPDEVYSAVFSPDGRQILTSCRDQKARIWSVSGDSLQRFHHPAGLRLACFSPDGRRVFSAGSQVNIWSLKGQLLDSLTHTELVNSIEFSPDGKLILTASNDHSARLWSAKGELLALYQKHQDIVNSASFSADGRHVLTACNNGLVFRWRSPAAIFEGLHNTALYRLSRQDKLRFGIE